MRDVVVGVLVLVVGGLFCFRGYLAMRVMIPIWGSLVGFVLGASLVATVTDAGFLGALVGWLVGFGLAILFGLVAYLYYEVSVILAMTSIGFTLGTTAMVALDVRWSWLVILVGLVVAVLLAAFAIAADLPTGILVVLTSLAGSSAMVLGVLLLIGRADTAAFSTATIVDSIADDWWWWVLYAALAVAGVVTQIRVVERLRTSMRAAWIESGGRELRKT
jgi:hypothetical protein